MAGRGLHWRERNCMRTVQRYRVSALARLMYSSAPSAATPCSHRRRSGSNVAAASPGPVSSPLQPCRCDISALLGRCVGNET